MVLEEASSSQEPSAFSESLPSGDIDQYAGDRNPTVLSTRDPSYVRASPPDSPDPVYINLANLPKSLGFGIFSTAHPPELIKAIGDSCEMASKMLGRPIRQEEADALAFHFAKSVRIGSYGVPIGVTLGMLQAYRCMSTFRFPGFTPSDNWKARGFPDRFGPFKGTQARMSWHFLRFNVYAFVGAMVGSVFFGSYALTVGSAGRMMDPRLKELSEKIRNRVQSGADGGLPGKREVDTTAGPRDRETFDMARQRQRAQEAFRRNQQQKKQQQPVDDMSPTGGSFGDEFIQSGDSGMMSDEQVSFNDNRKRQGELQQSSARWPEQDDPSRRQSDDHASLMASRQPAPKQSGSAWERLRQQAASSPQSQQDRSSPQSRRSGSTNSGSDSFGFSNAEEDRQLARSEVQRDFNARIEQEREGRDFSEQGARQSGWRR